MKKVVVLISLLSLFPFEAWTQIRKPHSIVELAVYTGPDREQLLYAGAKNEGTVTWYTSLAGDSYKAMARAFENKYPGVRVETYRAGGSELVVRTAEEVKARRPIFDALETTYDFMMVSRANHLTRPYNSPALAAACADEFRLRRPRGATAAPARRHSLYRLPSQPGWPCGPGEIPVWPPVERVAVQSLAPRLWPLP
jgi:hypothetical protein